MGVRAMSRGDLQEPLVNDEHRGKPGHVKNRSKGGDMRRGVFVAILMVACVVLGGLSQDVTHYRNEVVNELRELIIRHDWVDAFDEAIRNAQSYNVYDFRDLQKWDDYKGYLAWLDDLLEWAPLQEGDSRNVYEMIVRFYFILDQPPVKDLQSPILPEGEYPLMLTELSMWMVDFANAWGAYLDTPESAKYVKSFKDDIWFNWDAYMPPPASFLPGDEWMAYRTFNQFFARHVKPGMRPVAGLCDDSVIVSPADSTFVGWWQINEKSEIYVQETEPVLNVKGLKWSIEQLLKGSEYADRFKGGIFAHHFLNSFDYHRWHAPVGGKVLEARVIQGQVYLDVTTQKVMIEEDGAQREVTVLTALDGTGYQFVQTRGLIIIDSPFGLVACLPMGMAQVSSVVITAAEGVTLRKGEELGYFQFGGSDFVMVFERASNVDLTWQPGVHKQQGTAIGRAYPFGMD